ncbi:alpha-amylase family glycosyl hydrolase [Bergeyella sp. RCAD1439]|uniref:alpha-amylase family glycosyl hydrolase n=1 Tax=Bergeyella anatis TaxID=3113737 RepID=UPI002E178819|nr:alpha-amylase family glycosyl hydrolase [Bergeyella sp. RCAD1439]
MKKILWMASVGLLASCGTVRKAQAPEPFVWEGANLYFLLTDRFKNGDPTNDLNFGRTAETGVLRGFEGGDLRGVIQKIEEGYFTDLGVNAIWMTPLVEQIHGATNEGTGNTYGFHGYWAKDWTALDPNFGTKAELKELVEKAHARGIRVVLDAVINHTGPVTPEDPVFPASWVRTSPQCTYDGYDNTTACTLVANLPDVLTESDAPVELPSQLVEKWKREGRYEAEMRSLDAFFAKTGFPRAPKYYIMKWLADYITEFGIDGYRVDTVKHTNEDVWKVFQKVCQDAFDEYKRNNPSKVLDGAPFFTVGEVYGYGLSQKQLYDFGDRKVNYFQNGFGSLINFDFKGDANGTYEALFSRYSEVLHGELRGLSVMNYATSHDDGSPFDKDRKRSYETAVKLLLAPGISQIYYGDETGRTLTVSGAEGDANLRSMMNWEDLEDCAETRDLLLHWQKLGRFRAAHPSVGAGVHRKISDSPYWFSRHYGKDKVVVGLDLGPGPKTVALGGFFPEGTRLREAYSGKTTVVTDGKVVLDTPFGIMLLEEKR